MASASTPEAAVSEPITINKLAHRYLVYDVNAVTYLRQKYNIGGVLVGSLPQASQQNVFLGLPLELMPEEARVLVEKGVAHVVDDVAAHKSSFLGAGLSPDERKAYQAALRKQGQGAALEASKRSDDRKKAALKKIETDNWNDIPDDMFQPSARRAKKRAEPKPDARASASDAGDADPMLFAGPASAGPPKANRSRPAVANGSAPDPYAVTPTTSYPPLQSGNTATETDAGLIEVPKSYPVYQYLHEKGYFLAPGLRFGCQYMAYPGDPLRFHSHFLCNGMGWDEEFDLLDLVGGGRLGTGVKKGFLVGGTEQRDPASQRKQDDPVRVFCLEWGGM